MEVNIIDPNKLFRFRYGCTIPAKTVEDIYKYIVEVKETEAKEIRMPHLNCAETQSAYLQCYKDLLESYCNLTEAMKRTSKIVLDTYSAPSR